MRKTRLLVVALGAAVALGACRAGGEHEVATPAASPTPVLPAEWVGRVNPLADDAVTIARGRAVFLKNCSPCHGPEADGKGVASVGLEPPPANFREGKRLSSKGDDFVFWRIATGIPDTAMPAFAGTISEEDRWAILRFLRSLSGGRLDGPPTPHPERT